jgi:hypothetical protein
LFHLVQKQHWSPHWNGLAKLQAPMATSSPLFELVGQHFAFGTVDE